MDRVDDHALSWVLRAADAEYWQWQHLRLAQSDHSGACDECDPHQPRATMEENEEGVTVEKPVLSNQPLRCQTWTQQVLPALPHADDFLQQCGDWIEQQAVPARYVRSPLAETVHGVWTA